jgi:two-component system, cell cycle sensor histidine kinase and response regulator CckA
MNQGKQSGAHSGQVSGKSEDAFHGLIESSPDAMFLTDIEGIVTYINPAGLQILRAANTSQILGKPSLAFVHPDYHAAVKARTVDVLKSNSPVPLLEEKYIRLDGSVVDVEVSSTSFSYGGNPGIHVLFRDITKRKQAEAELLSQAEEMRWLMKSMANAFVIWGMIFDDKGNLCDIRFEYFNDAYEKPSGLKLAEVKGKTVREIWPTTEQSWFDLYGEVASTGKAKSFVLYHAPTKGFYNCTAYRPWDSPERICCVFEDITEIKRTEEALRANEKRYRVVADITGQMLFDYNVATGQMSWWGRIKDITGYSSEEFNRLDIKGWEALIHPEDLESAVQLLNKAMHEHTNFSAEHRLAKKDGSYIYIEAHGAFFYDSSGNAIQMLGSIKDKTEQKKEEQERIRLQEQLQQAMKMEAVGRLAGGVAHDFNNILTAIIGNVDLAKTYIHSSDPLAQYLDEIGKAADSAASLTQQLLAFSRKQIIEPRVLNLNELIRHLQKMLGRLIGEDIELCTILHKDLGSVKVDPGLFEQVLANLAVNARDSMPNGGRLLIETANIELDSDYCTDHSNIQPGRYVMLTVSDTGHGMSDEAKTRIFEPFFTTKPKGKGTGLGLSMIFGTVKQAGGAIEVYSEVGLGSTFKIYLPHVKQKAEKLVKEKPEQNLPKGNETVLLVEDESNVRLMAQKLLEKLGYKVIAAPNGNEALNLVERNNESIDLLITDVVMPGMNGRELATRLLLLRPDIKVLFTSGYTEDVIVHHGIMENNLSFIGKPYSLQTLAMKIWEVLQPGRR